MGRFLTVGLIVAFVARGAAPATFQTARKPAETDAVQPSTKPAANDGGVSVYFSPKGGCTAAITQTIDQAKTSLLIQAYSFTSAPIAKAVMDAHKRGVKVVAVLDASNRTGQYSAATFLANVGIPVFIDPNHAIARNKIILIDGEILITGGFNFSRAAEESNAENLLIVTGGPLLFAAYERNFQQRLAHSVKYESKTQVDAQSARGPPETRPALRAAGGSPAVTVYVANSGKKYHREGCAYLSKSSIPMDVAAAKTRGYTPCSKCNPPP